MVDVSDGGNTKTYISGTFDDLNDVTANFRIETKNVAGDIDLDTGTWCLVDVALDVSIVDEDDDGAADYEATTNSTGDYDLEAVPVDEDLLRFYDPETDYLTATATLSDFECGEDEVVDCELPCMVTITTTTWVSDTDQANLQLLTNATVDYSVAGVAGTDVGDCALDAFERSTKGDGNGLVTMGVPLLNRVLTYEVAPRSQLVAPRTFTKTIQLGGGAGTAAGGPMFATFPFSDTDCDWNPEADRTREITPTVLCAYGQVTGQVSVTNTPAEGYTVTATRVADGREWTAITNDQGLYLITLPTGFWDATLDSTFWIQAESFTSQEVEFGGCGESQTVNFP
jgi:hypothetical protein